MFNKPGRLFLVPALILCAFFLRPNGSLAQIVTVTDITGVQVPEYYQGGIGCGPLAAASLMGYWDQMGYEGLLGVSGWDEVKLTSNVSAELDILADYLKTNSSGWTQSNNVPPGLEAYALNEGGYEFDAENYSFSYLESLFRGEIDAGRPMMFLVDWDGSGSSNHFVPVFAYDDRGAEGLFYGYYDNWNEEEGLLWADFTNLAHDVEWGVSLGTTFVPLSEPDPVPIPGTLVLLSSGLIGLAAARRFRRRAFGEARCG